MAHKRAKWSEIPSELLALVLSSELNRKDILRCKAVCTSWYKAVQHTIPTSSLPWLLLPREQGKSGNVDEGFRFYSMEGEFYHMKSTPEDLNHGVCLGSSHGWLLFLNKQLEFMLFNPFSWIHLPLPPLKSFPDILSITHHQTYAYNLIDHCTIKYNKNKLLSFDSSCLRDLLETIRFAKAVLSSEPTCSNKDKIGVMVMYSFGPNQTINLLKCYHLAICRTAGYKWRKLNEWWYFDVTSHENQFYALRSNCVVEVWDFHTSLVFKKIQGDFSLVPRAVTDEGHNGAYIIKMEEDLLLVLSIKGTFPSQALSFLVYKLDPNNRWIEVESIGNRTLILGMNQSILISSHEAHEDSIYFVNELPNSSHYNVSVFSLRDKHLAVLKKVCDLPKGFQPRFFGLIIIPSRILYKLTIVFEGITKLGRKIIF